MNDYQLIIFVITLVSVLASIVVVLIQRHKTKKIMKALNEMLDSAMNGVFLEKRFDESLLSTVENRLCRYLTASAVSANQLSAEKDKIKELVTDISHQTKTPIANILLYAQLLEEQDLSKESRECVAALRGQADKLNFLISSLVKLSRLETGVFTLHPVSNAIAPMIEKAAEQFSQKAEQKAIPLTVDTTDAYAVFDYKWTLEALCNLLDNAIKYTPPGGRIKISVRQYELFCCIEVADTGIGISEEEQAKVFSRFYRSPSVDNQDGVGIGLYLTRQILTGQGGYIKVTSAPGSGSVFSMYLPRVA